MSFVEASIPYLNLLSTAVRIRMRKSRNINSKLPGMLLSEILELDNIELVAHCEMAPCIVELVVSLAASYLT